METLDKVDVIKLSTDELRALKTRQDVLMNKKIELNLLQNESDLHWLSLVKKYNLDERKIYNVDKDGIISEKEAPQNA
jgi:hypothetical protein